MGRMRPKDGIQAKLLRGFAFQSAAVLVLAFSSVMLLDWRRANRDLAEMEERIRADLDARGRKLSLDISVVIRSLVEDNAIGSIREIVDNLADRDSGIAYAAYMDGEMKPWAFRSRLAYGRDADMRESLRDSLSLWASGARGGQSRAWIAPEGEILEFAAPVLSPSGSRGTVRVGLDTRSMHAALRGATEHIWQNRRLTLGAFLAAALCAYLISLALSRVQAGRLTRPVLDLASSARRIAGGDYDAEFKVQGEGEIALLFETFEAMRRKVQTYMRGLESLVAEKMRQIGDLLENVDQGLFTFNLDLTVNLDHSARACSVLRLESLKDKGLDEILRMSPVQAERFRDWTEVVRREHATRRWSKLEKLAPVREISLPPEKGIRPIIEIGYRRILDAEGRLAKIMALAQDVTERRILERRLDEEKIRHENRVRIVLGVAGHAQEAVAEFLKDTDRRLESIRGALVEGGPAWKRRMLFDCHTLKGNAGGFGFDALAKAAHALESRLLEFRPEVPDDGFRGLAGDSLHVLEEETEAIKDVYRLLSGGQDRPQVRLDPDKVEQVQALAERLDRIPDSGAASELIAACRALRHHPFIFLARKYGELVSRAAEKLGKDAELVITPPEAEMDPALILRVDEALVHILRNAVAHGIEDRETRAIRGKGKGRIEIAYSRTDQGHVFSIRDDGNGIDGEALLSRAVEAGLMTREEASRIGPGERAQLLFRSGISTASGADPIAGRGQGMAIAWEAIRAEGGTLAVESWAGAGTRFILSLPETREQPASPEEPAGPAAGRDLIRGSIP